MNRDDEPAIGRCARCGENTVLEWFACDGCNGTGSDPATAGAFADDADCSYCQGTGGAWLTPCCAAPLLDEADACDQAYERRREEGWT